MKRECSCTSYRLTVSEVLGLGRVRLKQVSLIPGVLSVTLREGWHAFHPVLGGYLGFGGENPVLAGSYGNVGFIRAGPNFLGGVFLESGPQF